MYANAHAQCDAQHTHTHKQNYIEIGGIKFCRPGFHTGFLARGGGEWRACTAKIFRGAMPTFKGHAHF